jgi:hypothetical protein
MSYFKTTKMKNLYIQFAMLLFGIFLVSCTDDTGTVNVNYVEATAIYGDIDEIRALPLNEGGRSIQNPGKIYIGDDFILIGEEGQGIHVISNQDRSNPSSDHFLQIPGNKEFFVSGNTLYAESYYDVIKIDISDPFNAMLVSRSENAIQDNFVNDKGETLIGFSYIEKNIVLDENDDFMKEVVGDQLVYLDFAKNVIPKSSVPSSFAGNSANTIGTLNRITKANEHIYIVSNSNMIIIDDNNFNAEAIRLEGIKEDMETVFPYQNKLFVGSKTSMSVFDISTNNIPTQLTDFEHATSCDPVLPYSNVVYVTLRTADFSLCPGNSNSLLVIDINDVSNAAQLHDIQLTSPYGMTVINQHLFVGNGTSGLNIFNIEDPKNPLLIQEFKEVPSYDVIADPNNSDYIFITGEDGMDQYEIDNNFKLIFKSKIEY